MACSKKNCSSGCCCRSRDYAQLSYDYGGCGASQCSGCGGRPHRPGSCGCGSCGGRNRGCNGYGVLRSVSGPFGNCGNRCARRNHHDYEYFPFYTGPCGPCCGEHCKCCDHHCHQNGCHHDNCHHDDCCCDDCRPDDCCHDDCCYDDCCDPCCENACSTAVFTACAPLELAAGECVNFTSAADNSRDFSMTCDGVRIHRAGSYMVFYTVQVPANQPVSSRFHLTLNGEGVAAAAQEVATAADCTTNGYTMHAVVHACAGSLLRLETLNPVSIAAASAANVFTLSIIRLR